MNFTNRAHVALLMILAALLLAPPTARAQPAAAPPDKDQSAAIVPLVGEIDNYSEASFLRRFKEAKSRGAKVIVVSINSPGGGVVASMEISRFLKRQSDIRTIAYVQDEAFSGASMVAVACNEIWMAPESVIGDCAPIILVQTTGQLEALPPTERAKQESPVVDEFLDSARHNGYNPLILTSMVTLRDPIYVVRNDKVEVKVIPAADFASLSKDGQWKLDPEFENVNSPKTLVTLRPHQAELLGLSKGQAPSAQALLATLHDPVVADLSPGWGENIIEFLNNPLVRTVLLAVFLQSLYIILHAPGHGAAEATAVISLGALLGVPLLTGYAQWWEVAVIFGGLALCAFELFVFPGHFVSLITGSLMVVFGLVMTFVPTGLPGWTPNSHAVWHGVQTGLLAVVGAVICWILLSMWLRRYLPAIPYFRKLVLTATTGNVAARPVPGDKPPQQAWPFRGTVGIAVTDLRPGGSAEFPYANDRRQAAVVSEAGFVPRGAKIVVDDIQGGSVHVRVVE